MTRVTNNGQLQRIRTSTHRTRPAHELRVSRRVAPGQAKLAGVLDLLRDTTGHLVEYKSTAKLGVTLLMLGPLMRHAFGVGPGQRVPAQTLREVEKDLNARLAHAKFKNYDIPLEDFMTRPLDVYGARDQYLGIALDMEDMRLTGDRAIAERYFKGKYGLSNNEVDKYLGDLRPHITIGEIRYDQITDEEAVASLQNDPSTFILQASRQKQQRLFEYEDGPPVVPVIFPETISLNGLVIACQPKGS